MVRNNHHNDMTTNNIFSRNMKTTMKQDTFGIRGGRAASANSILLKSLLLLLLLLVGGWINEAWAATVAVKYHIVNSANTSVDAMVVNAGDVEEGTSLSTNFNTYRTKYQIAEVPFSDTYYTSTGTAITEVTSGVTDYYVYYTFGDTERAAVKAAYNIEFSSDYASAKWFNLRFPNRSNNWIYTLFSDWVTHSGGSRIYGKEMNLEYAFFAFMGDPYRMRIINHRRGESYEFQNDGNNIRMKEGTDYYQWAMMPKASSQSNAFQLLNTSSYRTCDYSGGGTYNIGFLNLASSLTESQKQTNDIKAYVIDHIFTFHVITKIGKKELTYAISALPSAKIEVPSPLQRKFITAYTSVYYEKSGTKTSIDYGNDTYQTLIDAGVSDVWIDDYTYEDLFCENYTDAVAKNKWYNMIIDIVTPTASTNSNWIHRESTTSYVYKADDNAPKVDDNNLFAFIGDPYEFKWLAKFAAGDRYMGMQPSIEYILFTNGSTYATWEAIGRVGNDGSADYGTQQFGLRLFNSYDDPYYVRRHNNGTINKYKEYHYNGCRLTYWNLPASYPLTYKFIDATTNEVLASTSTLYAAGTTDVPIAFPENLRRAFCTYSDLYTDDTFTTPAGSSIASMTEAVTIYIRCTVESGVFTQESDLGSNSQIKWKFLKGNVANPYLKTNDGTTLSQAASIPDGISNVYEYLFALVGNPYDFRIISRKSGLANYALKDIRQAGSVRPGSTTSNLSINTTDMNSHWEAAPPKSSGMLAFATRGSWTSGATPQGIFFRLSNKDVLLGNQNNDYDFTIEPYFERTLVTYHVYRSEGDKVDEVSVYQNVGDAPFLPETSQRAGAIYSYHQESISGVPYTELTDGENIVYVTYTKGSLPFQFSDSFEDAHWYNIKFNTAPADQWIGHYDDSRYNTTFNTEGQLWWNDGGDTKLGTRDNVHGYFAFIGDPYHFRVVNMFAGCIRSAIMDGDNVRMRANTDDCIWTLAKPYSDTGDRLFRIVQASTWGEGTQKYWMPAGNVDKESRIKLSTSTSTSYNLYAQEVPKQYIRVTYHICDENKSPVINYTAYYDNNTNLELALPNKYLRPFCDYTYYSDEAMETEVPKGTAFSTAGKTAIDYYVKFTLTDRGKRVFSDSETNPNWIHMIEHFGGRYVRSDESGNISRNNSFDESDNYQWCFVGNPYCFRVYNKKSQKYLRAITLGTNDGTKVNGAIGDTNIEWEAYAPSDKGWECDIILKYTWENPTQTSFYAGDRKTLVERSNSMDYKFEIPQTYTFNIVDNAGNIAIRYSKYMFTNTPLSGYASIPEAIRSPYIEGEIITFYKTYSGGGRKNLSGSINKADATETNIYVSYTNTHLMEKPLHLHGVRGFEMKVGDEYVYETAGAFNHTSSTDNVDDLNHLWYVRGLDPYAVRVRNVESGNYITANTGTPSLSLQADGDADGARFIIMGGEQSVLPLPDENWEDQFELMVANGTDVATSDNQFRISRSSDMTVEQTTGGTVAVQMQFNAAHLMVTYHIIDLQGKEAFKITSDNEELGLPAEFKSPLAYNFSYYTEDDFTITSGTYSLKSTADPITSTAESTGGQIYVKYEADKTTIDLDGRSTGKMYRLKFANGDTFHQENSDAVRTDLRQAVYPYSNGDASFYVYGEDKWQSDLAGASSTRTRWAWFVEGDDPYRVKISSYQTQTTESGTARHAYFRTYMPSDYNEVVTGSLTDNSKASTAGDLPSEYMLLGAKGAYKLVTINEVGTDNAGYQSTNFRVVNSFEEYWKNYPTVSKILSSNSQGSVNGEALTTAQETYMKSIDDTGHAWHTYTAWANAAPWVKRDDGTTNKQYEYKKHWYQTIQMGDGTFDFEDINFYGAIILVDNHGWEVMRRTMLPKDDEDYNERMAEIRAYDSPMVKEYQFWTDFPKASGYHIYRKDENSVPQGTGTSLTQAPFLLGSNKMGIDVYVTYTVKQRYKDIYNPETKESTEAFVLRQGDQLAKTEDGSSITYTAVSETGIPSGTIDGLNDDKLQWYLKPNATIDREMGYLYSGEPGAQDDAPTQSEYDAANLEAGLNVFDPYNVQIESKSQNGKYFTTHATKAVLASGLWSGDETSVSLADQKNPDTGAFAATGHDNVNCHVTNQTFMAVQDAHGNMRLMPRFDNTHIVEEFTKLEPSAAVRPYDDESGPQTTRLYQPNKYVYIVIDNQGREALGYTTVSSGAPEIPYKFASPLAKDFTFYKDQELTQQITGSFAAAGMSSGGTVYVRYSYDPDSDKDGLLKGYRYNMYINDQQTQLSGSDIASGNTYGIWRFMHKAADDADPYAVQLYNHSAPDTPVGSDRYIVMRHNTSSSLYALMKANDKNLTDQTTYSFLDGSPLPASVKQQSDYITADPALAMDASMKIRLEKATVFSGDLTYKIITNLGTMAIKGDTATLAGGKLKIPEWLKTPLMDDTAYEYYPAAEGSDETGFTVKGFPIETSSALDEKVVYVRYDYSKHAKGTMLNNSNNDLSISDPTAKLYLDGKTPIKFAFNDHRALFVNADKFVRLSNGSDYEERSQWLFHGDDPYEIKISNRIYGDDKFVWINPTSEKRDGTMSKLIDAAMMLNNAEGAYTVNTFMVLTSGSHNNIVIYATGYANKPESEGNIMLIEYSNALRAYRDTEHKYEYYYKNKTNQHAGNNSAQSNFFFVPAISYHIITNGGILAISCSSGTKDYATMTIPSPIRTPLIKASDFKYYTKVNTIDSKLVVDESSEIKDKSSIYTLIDNGIFDVYLRYTYDPENSIEFPNGFNESDGAGLDLNGMTWYIMLSAKNHTKEGGIYDQVVYVNDTDHHLYINNSGIDKENNKTVDNKFSFTDKQVLWRLEGNDPYAIKIRNAYEGVEKYVSGTYNANGSSLNFSTESETPRYTTFMYLTTSARQEINIVQENKLGAAFVPTGYVSDGLIVKLNTESSEIKLINTWEQQPIAPFGTQYGANGAFDIHACTTWITFVKAPATRKYRYHAVKFEGNENKGVAWDAVLEHDLLTPVVLEDEFTRLFAKYEKYGTAGDFQSREALQANLVNGTYDACFYSNEAMTERVYDTNNDTYDVYPEIEKDDIYDIYFKYQPMTNEEIQATEMYNTLPFQWSDETKIAADIKYHNENGKLEKGKVEANWYFMVLDTDEGVTSTVSGGTKTRVGNQYFLCREDEGTVDWMNNAFALHKDSEDNYNNYSYNRLAEWYKYGDNDAFREGRWLWAFVGGDPYNAKVVNLEARMGVTPLSPLGAYSLAKQDESCVTVSTTITDDNYPAVMVSDNESAGAYQWGLAPGFNAEQTLSLVSSTLHPANDENVNIQLFWTMVNKTQSGVTTDSVALAPRANDRSNAIQLLPYEPMVYQDINLAIRRDDEVGTYLTAHSTKDQDAQDALDAMKTGTVYMFFAAESREYAEGDIITSDNMPLIVKRQFCDYTFYSDDFRNPGSYTVQDGPYRYEKQTETITVDGKSITKTKFDDYGNTLYTYKYNVDKEGETPLSTPQTVYIKYEVTSDIFLKKHPNKAEVAEMTANNDHVYFMDFTDNLTAEGYDKGHHAYFDEEATFQEQIGTVHDGTSEKQIWNGSEFVDDTKQPYNFCQFKTTTNRMESVPENLKWYFVGDPYAVQVYCTEDEFNKDEVTIDGHIYAAGELASNLCRFDPTESKFQFVVDCVHLRTPAAEPIDKRTELDYHDPLTNEVIAGQSEDNPNYDKPYYRPFYWEVVPAYSDREGSFALRFKASNTVLGYRNVYYYLSHDGKTRTYKESIEEDKKVYKVNLSYDEENAKLLTSTKYRGYHKANDKDCVIHLVQPAKLYVSAYKENYSGEPVVKEELSEYFGVGETLTDVPRHLKRKYVKYDNWQYQHNNNSTWYDTSLGFTLTADKTDHAYNMEDCTDMTVGSTTYPLDEWLFTKSGIMNPGTTINGGTVPQKRASYKLRVTYTLDDETQKEDKTPSGIHLFTSAEDFAAGTPTWLDVKVGNNGTSGWLYYDKTNKGTDGVENQTTLLSNFGYSNVAGQKDGWSTGLKGLHWAFVGDPYNFTVVNRRRYEDETATSTDNNYWLGTHYGENSKTEKVRTGRDAETGKFIEEDKNVTYDYLWLGNTDVNGTLCTTTYDGKSPYDGINGEGGTGANGNTTWSLNYCKTGGDNDFFMRSASLKTTSLSELVGDYANKYVDATNKLHNETNDYERLIVKAFTSKAGANSGFVTTPFSLDTKTNQIDKVTIRTVTELDYDGGKNDCFDANVRIYNEYGEQKAALKHVEVVYGDVFDAMPYTLRRYGCTYTDCRELYYPDYTTADLSNLNNITNTDPMKNKSFLTDKSPAQTFSTATLAPANWLITDDNGRRYIEVAYTYKVNEDVAQFFTTTEAESMDDYTWTNPYYRWTETHPGGKTSYPDYINVFDHYVYSPDGHIIDEVYRQELGTKTSDGKPYTTTDYGWVNSHTGAQNAYANETTQDESDQQKWAFIGDPYSFELKNYAEYLEKAKSTLNYTKTDEPTEEIKFSTSGKTHWAIMQGDQETNIVDGKTVKVTDKDGNPIYLYYLALIDDDENSPTYGGAIKFVTFDRPEDRKDYKQYLYTKGGADLNYPTGNVYNTEDVKPFYISELSKYANLIVYHLVIAHQHSRDPKDKVALQKLNNVTSREGRYNKAIWETINNGTYQDVPYNVMDHLAEWDWYNNRISEKQRDDYPLDETEIEALGDKYIKPSSLRDVISDPIPDYSVQRVGIGNRLSVPWYMKRQFCTYDLYQRDVMRSVTNYEDPALEEADAEWTGETVTINGVKYKVDPTNAYTVDVEVGGNTYHNVVQKTFTENGETKRAYNVKWESVLNSWNESMDEASKPRGYDAVKAQNSHLITRLDDSHRNRMVIIDVVYHVNPEEFRFADKRRNTTAWYSMMTDNPKDGLMNFSYKDGIGARHGREKHYTNNYLWAPEGDPYGFVLHSRYATINGTGWDNVVVTTTGQLPTDATVTTVSNITKDGSTYTETSGKTSDVATYTGALSDTRFTYNRIMHRKKGDVDENNVEAKTWAARNAVYEMFTGSASNLFLMHPTSAYIDISTDKFSSFYMVHNTTNGDANFHKAELQYESDVKTLRTNPDANWRLYTTPEQLLPYFERSGYVGGLVPTIANHHENIDLYNTLTDYKQKYRTDPSVIDFKIIDKARELVYGGKFYTRSSNGSYTDELPYNTDRPTDSDKLPLKFVSTNLVPLQQGYYRIEAFSDNALNADGRNVDGTGEVGIIGPRFISGYRHQSEKDYEGYDGSTLKPGSRWLHFYETDEAHTTFHTFKELNSLIGKLNSNPKNYHNRDITPHPALRGNNEILPAEYDPSSIFYFNSVAPTGTDKLDRYDRYTFGTQNLWVRGRAGGVQGIDYEYTTDPSIDPDATTFGITKLVDNLTGTTTQGTEESTGTFDDRFRMDDIGGTAFTFRILSTTDTGSSPDKEIEENIKTNYLCIDANHRYRITIHTNNEMKEIGDSYDHLDAEHYWQLDDINYGIQDTKWLLKPVGTRTEWPYNEMPLRLKVNKGGVKKEYYQTNADGSVKRYETGDKKGQPMIDESLTCTPENVDGNYYASLYVPFDTKLNSTLDVAFTNIKNDPQPLSLTLSSVSQLNGTGNPQFIPAGWPVIIRSGKPKTGQWMKYAAPGESNIVEDTENTFKYVELNLPNRQTTSIPEGKAKIKLEGEYLEKEVAVSGKVMVFGLPFTEDGTKTVWSDTYDNNSKSYYKYDDTKGAVGFYTNENWWRGHTEYSTIATQEEFDTPGTDQAAKENAHWSTARNATSQQRNNKYVYHNKAYFVYATGGGAKPRYAVIFDGESTEDAEKTEVTEEEEAEQPDFTEKEDTDPWPCDVYDLQGRRVAVNETPQSLRRNHPGLPRGVYIFGHKKVIVK